MTQGRQHEALQLHVREKGYLLLVPSWPVSSPTAEKGNSKVFVFCKHPAVTSVIQCITSDQLCREPHIPDKQSSGVVQGITSLIEVAQH